MPEVKNGFLGWDYINGWRNAKKELLELYAWWKEISADDYEDKHNPLFKIPDEAFNIIDGRFPNHSAETKKLIKDACQWEQDFEDKKIEMCHRLLKVRGYMWT
jgi:hypothetical protein